MLSPNRFHHAANQPRSLERRHDIVPIHKRRDALGSIAAESDRQLFALCPVESFIGADNGVIHRNAMHFALQKAGVFLADNRQKPADQLRFQDMPGFFQIQRRPFAQHRLGQKRFHAAFRLFLCAFKLQIKSIRIDVQCAADKKRFDFSVFPKSRDKPRQHTRIKLIDAFNAAAILGRNRVTGWEIPKMRSELLTEKYGLITDCLAELTRELRKKDCTHLLDSYFRLNGKFNKRDEIAVRKTMSGLIKLIFPDENVTEEEMRRLLEYAIEGRRRVKEQLKLMAGVEFADVALGYVDEYGSETVVSVPEQASNTLIPAEKLPAGHVFALGASEDDGEVAVYRLENKVIRGNGKMERQGISGSRAVNECIDAAWYYFVDKVKTILPGATLADHDYLLYYADPQSKGPSAEVSVAELVGLCSAVANRPVTEATAVIGEIKLSGSMGEIKNLENIVRVAKNAGAKQLLLPIQSMQDLMHVPGELLTAVQPIFYSDPIDAVKKAIELA